MTINKREITTFYNRYNKEKTNKIIENAVTKNGIKNATYNNDVVREHNFVFSDQVKKAGITNQKSSGRCWLFATLNMLRVKILKDLNLESFELSENYLAFWSKLEKTNNFLELIIQNPKLKYDDRLWQIFVENGNVEDGGYWEWAQSLIKKYGIVPKDAMNETNDSQSTMMLAQVLNNNAFSAAKLIREAQSAKKSDEEIRKIKHRALNKAFDILAKTLGLAPQEFDFEYRDKDNKFFRVSKLTPLQFLDKYIGKDYLNKINLTDDPRKEHAKCVPYATKYIKALYEGKNMSYINAELKDMKKAVIASIKDEVPVWFDCDVTALYGDRKAGILDPNIYSINDSLAPYDRLTKEDRVNYRYSLPNHAMVLIGVDLDEKGNPIKWEVENSWGDENGKKGYFSMSDKFFDEYLFGVIVDPKYVDKKYIDALEKQPVELEPWDPLA